MATEQVRGMLAAAAVASLLAVAARAQPSATRHAPIVLGGAYVFTTNEQQNGAPACTEHWLFERDGTLIIHSGAEITTKRVRIETRKLGRMLALEPIETNGEPDCRGRSRAGVVQGEAHVYLYRENHGRIATCYPPVPTGYDGNTAQVCFGHLVRATDE